MGDKHDELPNLKIMIFQFITQHQRVFAQEWEWVASDPDSTLTQQRAASAFAWGRCQAHLGSKEPLRGNTTGREGGTVRIPGWMVISCLFFCISPPF